MGSPLEYVDFPVRVRTAQVERTTWISSTSIRLTVGGATMAGFQSGVFDEHVKLIYPDPGTGALSLPTPDGDELDWPRPFPTSREYTVRAHRPGQNEIDIDFVAHAGGLAADWVRAVKPGDPVHIAGPPGGYRVPDDYSHYLLAGDETALPAIARWLEEAPGTTRGWVVVEVPGPGSRVPLAGPDGVEVRWLHSGDGDGDGDLAAAVRGIEVPEGADVFVWLAGEAGAIKPLRPWVRGRGIGKEHSSITGYWKRGRADTHEHLDDDTDAGTDAGTVAGTVAGTEDNTEDED